MAESFFHLFVYASLRDPNLFRRVTGRRFPEARPAVLDNYGFGEPVEDYPAIIPEPGNLVEGLLLLNIESGLLTCLDRYEAEGMLYRRILVQVKSSGSVYSAYTYIRIDQE